MTQEQVLEAQSMCLSKSELRKLLETYKQEGIKDIKKYDDLILDIKKIVDVKKMVDDIYFYIKEHHEDLLQCCKLLVGRLDTKDNQICIEGETGSGKSILTMCIMCVLAHMLGQKFDLEKNVLYLPRENELARRLESLKDNELLWVDETIKSLNRQRWQNKDAQESNEIIQTERYRHNTVVYCIPSFEELTRSFRDTNIKFRIWIAGTAPARAVLRAKEKHPDLIAKYGAWHTDERAAAIKGRINPLTTVFEYIQFEKKMAGYIIDFSWADLTSIEELNGYHLLYEALKKRARVVVESQSTPMIKTSVSKGEYIRKRILQKLMYHQVGIGGNVSEWVKKNIPDVEDSVYPLLVRDFLAFRESLNEGT